MYDIKYLMKFCDNLHGGLNKLAEVLQVERIGPQHQVVNHALDSESWQALQIFNLADERACWKHGRGCCPLTNVDVP